MKKLIILFFGSGILISSCSKYMSYKYFTLGGKRLNENVVLKNGFYYCADNEITKGNTGTRYEIYFLYKDGTIGQTGYFGNNIKEYGDKLKNEINFRNSEKAYMDKFKRWGKYQISGNNLLIQSFELYSEIKYTVYEHRGNILSDSSFIINAEGFLASNSGGVKSLKKPNVFLFYPCETCKPDSLNWLMKRKFSSQ